MWFFLLFGCLFPDAVYHNENETKLCFNIPANKSNAGTDVWFGISFLDRPVKLSA